MGAPLDIPADYEPRVRDFAREVLDAQGVRELTGAEVRVRWFMTPHGRMPALILAFDLPEFAGQRAIPSLAIALVTVRKGTLFDVLPGTTLYEGDRLRDHILRSVDDYLTNHGVKLTLNPDEAARHAGH